MTTTPTNHDKPAEVLERYLQAKPKLEKFYDMAVNYFKCKCLGKTNLERRPPVALCLRDPDHVFTIKPGFQKPRKQTRDGVEQIIEYGMMLFDNIYIDCVSINETPHQNGVAVIQHHKACGLRLTASGELSQSGVWYYRLLQSPFTNL